MHHWGRRLIVLFLGSLLLCGCKLTIETRVDINPNGSGKLTNHLTGSGLFSEMLTGDAQRDYEKQGWKVQRWLEGDKTHLEFSRSFRDPRELDTPAAQLKPPSSAGKDEEAPAADSPRGSIQVDRRDRGVFTEWVFTYRLSPSPADNGAKVCSTCEGSGQPTCSVCEGRGQSQCFICHGAGQSQCFSCSGSGSQPDLMSGGTTTCVLCDGRGRTQCAACAGQGQRACALCKGNGRTLCSSCNGTGEPGQLQRQSEEQGKAMARNMFQGQISVGFPGGLTASNADRKEATEASWVYNLDTIERGATFTATARQVHWDRIGMLLTCTLVGIIGVWRRRASQVAP